MPKKILKKSMNGEPNIFSIGTGHVNTALSTTAAFQHAILQTAQYTVANIMAQTNSLTISQPLGTTMLTTVTQTGSYAYLISIGVNAALLSQDNIIAVATNPAIQNLIVNYATNYIISDADLHVLYNTFVQPFITQGPFYMGSITILNTLYTHLAADLLNTTNAANQTIIKIFQDILTVLIQSRDIYFDNLRFTNEIKTLREKYQLSLGKIKELTLENEKLKQEEMNEDGRVGMQGSLGIKFNKPKNLIYAQAIMNLNLAWYYYLHKKSVIDPALYMATTEYVKGFDSKAHAYQQLLVLLDEEFKTLDEE